jgi:hypothetical protein
LRARFKGGELVSVRRILLVIAACAVALSGTGCAKLEKAFTPPPKIVTKEATVAAPAAQVIGEVAKDAPQDVPMWPGSTVEKSKMRKNAYTLTLAVPEPYKIVLPGLVTGFERSGWTVAREDTGAQGAEVSVLTVESATWGGMVTVTATAQGATVEYTLTELTQ